MPGHEHSTGCLVRALTLVLAIVLCSLNSTNQSAAVLDCTVTDPSKAVIPGAAVTLRNVETGVETVKETNNAGYVRERVASQDAMRSLKASSS